VGGSTTVLGGGAGIVLGGGAGIVLGGGAGVGQSATGIAQEALVVTLPSGQAAVAYTVTIE